MKDNIEIHIGYDHESVSITIRNESTGQFFHDRDLLEDCDYINLLINAFKSLGCKVTSQEEY